MGLRAGPKAAGTWMCLKLVLRFATGVAKAVDPAALPQPCCCRAQKGSGEAAVRPSAVEDSPVSPA